MDYTAGKVVKYCKANERIKKANDKKDAIMAFCKGGWRAFNVVRAQVVSATMYGAKVNGVLPAHLVKIRAMLRRATSTRAGGSTTAALALHADPMYRACQAPIIEWASRVNLAHWHNDNGAKRKLIDACGAS